MDSTLDTPTAPPPTDAVNDALDVAATAASAAVLAQKI